MKSVIPRYNFYKTKYGSELLIDVVDLKYTRKFLTKGSVHILTYYDITFITEGEGNFTISNRTHQATPGDVFFSKPGEVRSWDTDRIGNGYALIFEDTFLTSFFKDPLFVRHLPFFRMGKTANKLHLPDGLYSRMLQLLHNRLLPPTRYGHIARLTLRGPHATQPCLPHFYSSGIRQGNP